MSATTQRRIKTPRARRKGPESTGFRAPGEQPVTDGAANERPLATAWITDELLEETIDVWSEAYGRPITEEEAVEILVNVRRLGQVLLKARKEMDKK
ncbi:MAG: hypothetical protein R6X20_13290 [Phycisphaerae bacterium]